MTNQISILLVDDEPDMVELTSTYLQRSDHRLKITTATSTSEGLDLIAEENIDCVVADYDMPGMNGLAFLSAVRENYPDLPFILFTGKGSEEIASEAMSAGATDYLQKRTGSEQFELLTNRIINAVSHYRQSKDPSTEDIEIDDGKSINFAADTVPTQPDRPLEEQDEDKFQRVAFARYLAQRVHAVDRKKAYSIHIHGPWGSGKTTLLNFLETELRKKSQERSTGQENAEQYQVVKYNAWQHQHIQPPWWSLMDNIYQQTKSELSFRHKISEAWWRLSSGRLGFFLGVVVLAWIVGLSFPFLLHNSPDSLVNIADAVGKISAALVTVLAGIKAVTNSMLGGSAQAAQSYVDYSENPMNTIKNRFNRLINRIPQPVAVFIDDLDRCDCHYVVELLEGIQTLFTDAPIVFVVAADRDWLINCFEKEYENQSSRISKPGKSLGGLFLEKTFQFSTSVPTIADHMKEEYWENLLMIGLEETTEETESQEIEEAMNEEEILNIVENAEDRSFSDQQSIREDAVERLASPEIMEHTEHILQPFSPLMEPNPRAMKRLVSKYSVNRALAILAYVDIERHQLALWTILSLEYPKLAELLENNPEMIEQVGQDDPDVEVEFASLFTNPRVVDIVAGSPIQNQLDEEAVRKCAQLHL